MKYLLILVTLSLFAVVFSQDNCSCLQYSLSCKDGSEVKSTCVANDDGTCASAVPICPDVVPEVIACNRRLTVLPRTIDEGRKSCEYDNLCRLQFATTCNKTLAYARCVEPTKELCLQTQVCAKRDTNVEILAGEFIQTLSEQGSTYPNIIFPSACLPVSVARVENACCSNSNSPCDFVDCAEGYQCTLSNNKTRGLCTPIEVDPVERNPCAMIRPDTPNAAEICQKTTYGDNGATCQPIFGTACRTTTNVDLREIDNAKVFVECRQPDPEFICPVIKGEVGTNYTNNVIRPVCAVHGNTGATLLFDNACLVGAEWKILDDVESCCKVVKECNCKLDNQYCDRTTGECHDITPCATIKCRDGSRCIQNNDGTYGCTTTPANTVCAHLDGVDFSAKCLATTATENLTIAKRFLGFGIIGGKVQAIYGCSDMGYKLFASEEEIYRACVCNPNPIRVYAASTIACVTTTLLGYRADPNEGGKCGEYVECTVPSGIAVTSTLEECQKRCEANEQPNPCATVLCAEGSICTATNGKATCVPVEKPPCNCKDAERCENTDRGNYCVIDKLDCRNVKCERGKECRLDEKGNPFCDSFSCATCLGDNQKCIRASDGSAKCIDISLTCANVLCAPGLKCIETEKGPSCVQRTCDDVQCARGEVCVARDNGAVACVPSPIIRCPPIEIVKSTAEAALSNSDITVDKISPAYVDCTLTGSFCAEDTPGRPYCTDPTKPQYCSVTYQSNTVVAKPGTAFKHPDGCNWCKCLDNLEYVCTEVADCDLPIKEPPVEDYTCDTHICPRGQTCSISKRGVPVCTCPEGTTGDFCQYKVCDKDNDCNDNSAFCLIAADATVKPRCKCPPGFLVTNRGCVPIVIEDPIVCGKDEVTNNELRCVCRPGYERKNAACAPSVRDDIVKRVIRKRVVPALQNDDDIADFKFYLSVSLKTDISTIDVKILTADKAKRQSDDGSDVEISLTGNDNETPSDGDTSTAGPYALSEPSSSNISSEAMDGTDGNTPGDAEESSASSLSPFF